MVIFCIVKRAFRKKTHPLDNRENDDFPSPCAPAPRRFKISSPNKLD
jgi:hypothetical protein